MKTGADISHHQDSFDAGRYYGSGEDFIFHKATERADFTSSAFASRWRDCAGKPRGAYHFARPTGGDADADAEAAHFVKVVRAAGWRPGDTWALDLEDNDGGLSPRQLLDWSDRWCARVRAALPSRGLFYSYIPFVINTMGNPGRIPGSCLGWIARYRTDDPYAPIKGIANAQPRGWPDPPHVWQCSNGITGCVKTVASVGKCDYNRMTDGAFDVLFGAGAATSRPWWLEPLSAGQLAQIKGAVVEGLQ